MNKKRAILIALALYVSTLIVGIILTIFAKVNLQSPQEIPTTYWIITIVVTVLLTSIASIWYFNKKGTIRNTKEGLKLGWTFICVGFILDALFFIPAFFSSGVKLLFEYYINPSFYITLLLVIATATFIGSRHQTKSEKQEKSSKKK